MDNPLSLNRYMYVHNNPLRYVDRDGHRISEPWGNGGINKDQSGILRTNSGKGTVYWEYYDSQNEMYGPYSVPQQIRSEYTGNVEYDEQTQMFIEMVLSGGSSGFVKGAVTGATKIVANLTAKNVGKFYKGVGTVLDKNPLTKITGISQQNPGHLVNRAIERGITPDIILNTFKNPKVVTSQWNGQRFAYISDDAVVILNNKGELVTVWGKKDFDDTIHQVLKEATD